MWVLTDISSTFFASLGDLLRRLQNAITFTLIRYLYATLLDFTDVHSILVVSTLVVAALQSMVLDTTSLGHEIKRVTALLWNQTVVNIVTQNNSMFHVGYMNVTTVMNLTAATMLLVASSVVGNVAGPSSWLQQCLTMILFMYAEAMQQLLTISYMDTVLLPICALVYFVIVNYNKKLSVSLVAFQTITQALQMVCVNLVLASIVPRRLDSKHVHAGFLLLVLLVLDALSSIVPQLTESKEYALWKVAARLSLLYSETELPVLASMLLIVLLLHVKAMHVSRMRAVLDVVLLTLLNTLLTNMSANVFSASSYLSIVNAFSFIVIFNILLRVLV